MLLLVAGANEMNKIIPLMSLPNYQVRLEDKNTVSTKATNKVVQLSCT